MAAKVSSLKITAIVYSAKALKPRKKATTARRTGLRSASCLTYQKPRICSKFDERAFSYLGPATWNSLPVHLQTTTNANTFKHKHRFCVIFGCGQNKFRTDIVEDLFDNPVFNTECEIPVDDVTQPLTFLVTEKNEKDVLGQVVVPLSDLVTFRTNHSERVPLRAHKKCPHPQGELVFEAWISAGSVSSVLPTMVEEEEDHKSAVHSGLKKLKEKLTHSPMLSRKSSSAIKQHKRNNSDGLQFPVKPNSSVSCQDLSSLSTYNSGLSVAPETNRRSFLSAATNDGGSLSSVDSVGLGDSVAVVSIKPEVTGVSPKEGPVDGGTRLTIRGANLGRNKEDVIGLFVGGSNVLSTLEFVSSSKLVCTTKAHKVCSGNVIVETQSGGRGVSFVQFTFLGAALAVQDTSDNVSEASSSLSRSSSRGDADIKRDGSFKSAIEKEKEVSALSSIKTSLKSRSMFDLSLAPKVSVSRPEVTGVSPCDGPALSSTRLVIRGKNLGKSRADIVSVTVAGVDCTDSLEYDSSSRLTCFVGPTQGGANNHGDVIVETKSGGVGVSTVQFRFIESVQEETEWAAIPYDGIQVKIEPEPIVVPSHTPVVPVETSRSSISLSMNQRSSMTSSPTTVKQPPPIVEIQPMSRPKVTPASPQRKAPAPSPPSVITYGSKDNVDDSPEKLRNSQVIGSHVDNELRIKLTELSKQLSETGDQVRNLQIENKSLKDENERIRLYMESLVSRAIAICPQILCVDT